MSFKKILPWLAGFLVLALAFAAVPLSRFLMFSRFSRFAQLPEEGMRRALPGVGGQGAPMMGTVGSRLGGLMGGFEVLVLPIFFVALFLFTVWAFLKIVRSTPTHPVTGSAACQACGYALTVGWKYCPNCGAEQTSTVEPPPAAKS